MDWRLRKMELWVGGLAGGAIVLFATLFLIQGGSRKIFSSGINLHMYMPRSYGLHAGAPVKLLDFSVGSVTNVVLQDDMRVKVLLQADKGYSRFIRTDSRATLKTTVIGEAFIDISPGDKSNPELTDMSEIEFVPFKDKVDEITSSALKLMDSLSDPNHTVGKMLKDQGEVYASITATLKNVENLTNEVNKLLGALNDREKTVGAMLHDKTLYDKIMLMQGQTEKLLVQLNSILKDIKGMTSQAPELMKVGNVAANDAAQTMSAVKRIWPISAAISQPEKDELIDITPR